MNKNIQNILSTTVILVVLMFSGIGLHETVTGYLNPPTFVSVVNTPEPLQPVLETKKADYKIESVEFITGPLAAGVGELCVFKLNDPETRADWIIVPSATCYIDSSGSSLAFASNVPAKYTIIAAIVEDGDSIKKPKILTHVCDYGVSPEPTTVTFNLGIKAKLFLNATEMKNVTDVMITLDAGEVDVTTRDNDGFRATMGGLKECTIEFDMLDKAGDTSFSTIQQVWYNSTSVNLKALSSSTGSGPHGDFSITGFSRSEALEEAVKYSVTAKLTKWIAWASGS